MGLILLFSPYSWGSWDLQRLGNLLEDHKSSKLDSELLLIWIQNPWLVDTRLPGWQPKQTLLTSHLYVHSGLGTEEDQPEQRASGGRARALGSFCGCWLRMSLWISGNTLALSRFYLPLEFLGWVMVCNAFPGLLFPAYDCSESLPILTSGLPCLNNRTEEETVKWC